MFPTKFLLAALAAAAIALAAPAHAGDGPCMVNDPTDTPLNVRSAPNGQILGALHNYTQVFIVGSAVIGGRRWVRILPEAGKKGWVFGDYITCD
jgi:uncharacterized protein YraI